MIFSNVCHYATILACRLIPQRRAVCPVPDDVPGHFPIPDSPKPFRTTGLQNVIKKQRTITNQNKDLQKNGGSVGIVNQISEERGLDANKTFAVHGHIAVRTCAGG